MKAKKPGSAKFSRKRAASARPAASPAVAPVQAKKPGEVLESAEASASSLQPSARSKAARQPVKEKPLPIVKQTPDARRGAKKAATGPSLAILPTPAQTPPPEPTQRKGVRKPPEASESEERAPLPKAPGKAVKKKAAPEKRKVITAAKVEVSARAAVKRTARKRVSRPEHVGSTVSLETVVPVITNPVTDLTPQPKVPARLAAEPARTTEAPQPAPAEPKAIGPWPAASPPLSPANSESPARPVPNLPAILMEGDEPSAPPVPSHKEVFAADQEKAMERGQLPQAYGSGRLSLVARDPHSIYAHWDFTLEQQNGYNALSADKHLILLIWQGGLAQRLVSELSLHPESRHWFVHVPVAGGTYCAELGYYDATRRWTTVAVSELLTTPGGVRNAPAALVFARLSIEPEPSVRPVLPQETPAPPVVVPGAPGRQGMDFVSAAESRRDPLDDIPLHAGQAAADDSPLVSSTADRHPGASEGSQREASVSRMESFLPDTEEVQTARPWTSEEAMEMLALTGLSGGEAGVFGSIEVVDLLQRLLRGRGGVSSLEALEFGMKTEQSAEESITSPGAPMEQKKGQEFWMNVNAELVIYGATEPDAEVSIGGRQIRLRPDGSFSYRFSLPDGYHELPIQAVSIDGEHRGATLRFGRETIYQGEVGAHWQDPSLAPPSPANIPQ